MSEQTVSVNDIPDEVADAESLNRRIHPNFIKPDGSVSSQAFTDTELSVDRANYWEVALTLRGYEGYGVAGFLASAARQYNQEVIAVRELLNPAHAEVRGKKTKSVARGLARAAMWVVHIGDSLS